MEGKLMSQNSPEGEQIQFTTQQVRAAEDAEQKALQKSQNEYLTRRVVVLRAQLDRANQDLTDANARIAILEDMLPKDVEPGDDDGPQEGSNEEHPSDD
jgi:hypothetical protein